MYKSLQMIRKKIFDEDHADVASSYNNMATVYHSFGKYNQAKHLNEKARIIRKTIFSERHAAVATSYNNLSSLLGSNLTPLVRSFCVPCAFP